MVTLAPVAVRVLAVAVLLVDHTLEKSNMRILIGRRMSSTMMCIDEAAIRLTTRMQGGSMPMLLHQREVNESTLDRFLGC
jgi:hypothetical protein